MVSSRITLLDPIARVTVRDERIVVRTVGVQGPPGPPTITPGAVVTAEGDLIVGGSGGTPIRLPGPPDMGYELASIPGPTAFHWRGAQVRDIRDWYYEDDTRTDQEVFAAMAADLAAAGGGAVAVTPKPTGDGSWSWHINDLTTLVNLPSNTYLFGTMDGGGRFTPTGGNHELWNAAVFRIYGPVTNGRIEGLTFKGENGDDGVGFVHTLNRSSNCILFQNNDSALGPSDWRVDRCTFKDLHGFSTHSTGGTVDDGPRRLAVTDSVFTYCGNGVNLCGAQCQARGNTIFNSEGFENTGRGLVLADNTGIDLIGTCAAIGGAGQDDGPATVVGNVFYGSTGEGISVGDGVHDAVIAGNIVLEAATVAYREGVAFEGWAPYNLSVHDNVFLVAAGAGIAMFTGAEGSSYDHNRVGGGTQEAIQIGGVDQTFRGNIFSLGSSAGRAFQLNPNARDIFFAGDNVYTPFAYFDASGGAATFAPGSEFRFTSLPAAAAMWGGGKVLDTGGAGVADIYAMCAKDAANAYYWHDLLSPRASSHGTANVADGGTIAHGLGVAPTWVGLTPKVGGRIAVVAGLDSTNITIDLKDHAGTDIAVAENVMWRAEI